MSEYVYQYVELPSSPLVVEAVYKGGTNKNVSDDPISKLLKGTGNQGGFRKAVNPFGKVAYVVIYSSNKELAWPDYLDTESGVFRYYGDNRKPGSAIHETKRGGNLLLREVFDALHGNRLEDIPPFFIFEKADSGRDVRFRGLAVPGNPSIPSDRDLVAFWRTMDGKRFQNYEAYFTILDTGSELITREWIDGLLMGTSQAKDAAPKCWKEFLKKGRAGIKPLRSQRIDVVRKKEAQEPQTDDERKIRDAIYDFYSDNPYGFEACAARIVELTDSNFERFELTRPWRDGGRDAVGTYRIGPRESTLSIECSLEAKCRQSIGVKEMSRLISRIKYRQFGIMVTTGYVSEQAYREVVEDGHPIMILSGGDIARILIEKEGVTPASIVSWLESVQDDRL